MKKREQKESADEKMLGKVIAAELRQQLREAESDCPETEIVAAFYDRTLSDREKKIWEKHFLKCLRCQEYLAEIARLSDADEALPLHHEDGEYEASDQSGGWFYRLAWVVPFLIIGVLSAVWYRDEVSRYVGIPREPSSNVSEPAPAEEQPRPEAKAQAKGYQAKAGNAVAPNVTGTRKAPAGRESQAGATGTGVMAALRDRAEMAPPLPKRRRARAKQSRPGLQISAKRPRRWAELQSGVRSRRWRPSGAWGGEARFKKPMDRGDGRGLPAAWTRIFSTLLLKAAPAGRWAIAVRSSARPMAETLGKRSPLLRAKTSFTSVPRGPSKLR